METQITDGMVYSQPDKCPYCELDNVYNHQMDCPYYKCQTILIQQGFSPKDANNVMLGISEGLADIKAGRVKSWEQVKRELERE